MKRGLPILLFFVAAFAIFIAGRCCNAERVMRMSDRRTIGFARMITEIRRTHLIFIGEDHDRMEDHRRQLKIIRALNKAGTPLAIGLEMFTAESQGLLDRWVAGKLDEQTFRKIYKSNWDMPWYLYRDIFLYARKHRIPLVGLNVPREIVHKVAREGFAALTPEERKMLPTGITCNVDSAYKAMVRRAFAEHSANDDSFLHFCEAQMLWNKGMAWHLQEYMRGHPAVTEVVLTGTGHAMKPGIPGEVADEGGIDSRVILPEDDAFNRKTATAADADYLMER